MIVVDASVLLNALLDDGKLGTLAREMLSADTTWAAPGHLFVECLSVIRRFARTEKITQQRAEDAVNALHDLVLVLSPTQPLVRHVWSLRDHLTSYDAAYVVTAWGHGCRLVTSDVRLARACTQRNLCDVTLVAIEDQTPGDQ